MLVARVLAAAGLVSSMTLVLAPAMATEPALIEHGATAAVIHRIQPTPPVAVPTRETPAHGACYRALRARNSRIESGTVPVIA